MGLEEKLQYELSQATSRVNAFKTFSDLEEVTDQWGIVRLTTSEVNKNSDKFEVRNECDCCPGANKYALPYIEFESIRLYSNPCAISFAKNYNGLAEYQDDWDESEEWLRFNDVLLQKISEWIDVNESEHDNDYDDDDEDELDFLNAL